MALLRGGGALGEFSLLGFLPPPPMPALRHLLTFFLRVGRQHCPSWQGARSPLLHKEVYSALVARPCPLRSGREVQ